MGKEGVLLGEQWGLLNLPPNTVELWLVAPGGLE